MKHVTLLLFAWVLSSSLFASETPNALESWISFTHIAPAAPPAIAVDAKLIARHGKYLIAFHLTNISSHPITTHPSMLPWGNSNSITLAAITSDGKQLQIWSLIDDPGDDKPITIQPAKTCEGEYQLQYKIDPRTIPKDRDTVLLWAYALFETGAGHKSEFLPVCTGVLVLPKSR